LVHLNIAFYHFTAWHTPHYLLLTNSPWDEDKINNRRIEIIQRDKRTRSYPDGSLIIDDVACKKSKSATKIEAAKVQY